MNTQHLPAAQARKRRGFSMVEMIACVSIIGIVAFLAIPSVTRMRGDSERNLAISRAEALNLAQATYIQVKGRTQAATAWFATGSGQASWEPKFTLLKPYLAYAESSLALFMPEGYKAEFPPDIATMTKTVLRDPNNAVIYY